MTADVLESILTWAVAAMLALVGAAHLLHPGQTARPCAAAWYVNGMRPTGLFECRPVLGRPEDDLADARRRLSIADDRAELGWLWCTGGARPIAVDGHTVGCQR